MSRDRSAREELVASLAAALRRLSAGLGLFEAAVAEQVGMHPTDVQVLGLIELHEPVTAGRLAELSGLTTGAITGVLDRLEHGGHIRRLPDPADRRKVVITTLDAGRKLLTPQLDRLREVAGELAARYTDDELATVLDYVDRLRPLVEEETAELRSRRQPRTRATRSVSSSGTVLSAPLGRLEAATLRFPRGAGHLRLLSDPTLALLFEAEFLSAIARAKVDGDVVSVQFRKSPFGWRAKHGVIRLNASVVWAIEMVGGVTRLDADLTKLSLSGITVTGGLSHVSLDLPAPRGVVPVRITGGVNDLSITRPVGTAAELKVRGGAVNVTFDGRRSSAAGGEARWSSEEQASPDRYELEIVGGARTVLIATR